MLKVFDAHCDTVFELCEDNSGLFKNNKHIDIERLSEFDTYVQIFAAFIDKKNISMSPMNECLRLIDKYKSELKLNRDRISPIESLSDLIKAECGGVHSILSIEGGEALEGDIANIKKFYDMGVRLITLTWNYANELADGISEERGGGLTEFGKKAVSVMEDIGIMIDVSHLSYKGFFDVAENTRYPFAASHSCVKSLCSNQRNLDDEQIKTIINRNGFIGVNFYPLFLYDSGKCKAEKITEHIRYILDMGGENVVGLGSDFDGVSYLPDDMKDVMDMRKVLTMIKEMDISDKTKENIAFGNLYRLFYDLFKRQAEK